jgi:dihydrofolate synthase/folylpolyglutamate synthase
LAGRCDLVFGGLADKDLRGVFEPVAVRARRIVLTAPDSPRAESPDRLAARLGREDVQRFPRLAGALALLDAPEGQPPVPIIVAGSLVLVGEALGLHRALAGEERTEDGHAVNIGISGSCWGSR